MNLIYKNNYGSSYKVDSTVTKNPERNIQVYIGTIGIYMTQKELSDLYTIIKNAVKMCDCSHCKGQPCNRIWTSHPLIDICLKIDENTLDELEDLISWTKFLMNFESNLEENNITGYLN
ncbi:MAG: hypothetical protein H6584_05080 [Flavobacteriales bacterium]|nr:hypothetical protein [Flavobacteriales bacterium]